MAGMIFVWSARRSTIVEGGVVVVVPKRTWARYSRLCIAPSSAMLLRWLTRSRGGITWAKKETFPTHARIMPADRPQQLCGCCVHANRRIRYNRKDLKNVHILRRKARCRLHGTTTSVRPITCVLLYGGTLLGLPIAVSARMDEGRIGHGRT